MQGSDHPWTDRKVELLILVAIVIWAVNYPVAKYSLGRLDIFVFNSIRYVVASILLVALSIGRVAWTPVAKPDRWKIVGAGLLANVVYQVAFVSGLNLTTAGNSAVLLSTSPLWTIFLNARLRAIKIPRGVWAGMALSLFGVALIIVGSGKKLEFGSHALLGDVICLGAAALWGLNTNIQKPLLQRCPPMQLTLLMTVVGAVGLTGIAVPSAVVMNWADVPWTYYAAAIASGLLSIAVAGVFWSQGVKRFSPGRVANFNNLVPVVAFAFSYFLLDEHVFAIQVLGAATTVVGVWIARRGGG